MSDVRQHRPGEMFRKIYVRNFDVFSRFERMELLEKVGQFKWIVGRIMENMEIGRKLV